MINKLHLESIKKLIEKLENKKAKIEVAKQTETGKFVTVGYVTIVENKNDELPRNK